MSAFMKFTIIFVLLAVVSGLTACTSSSSPAQVTEVTALPQTAASVVIAATSAAAPVSAETPTLQSAATETVLPTDSYVSTCWGTVMGGGHAIFAEVSYPRYQGAFIRRQIKVQVLSNTPDLPLSDVVWDGNTVGKVDTDATILFSGDSVTVTCEQTSKWSGTLSTLTGSLVKISTGTSTSSWKHTTEGWKAVDYVAVFSQAQDIVCKIPDTDKSLHFSHTVASSQSVVDPSARVWNDVGWDYTFGGKITRTEGGITINCSGGETSFPIEARSGDEVSIIRTMDGNPWYETMRVQVVKDGLVLLTDN